MPDFIPRASVWRMHPQNKSYKVNKQVRRYAHLEPRQLKALPAGCRAGILLVDNAAISGAIKDVFNHCRTVLEPAGAVAVAGAKAYLKSRPHLQVPPVLTDTGFRVLSK